MDIAQGSQADFFAAAAITPQARPLARRPLSTHPAFAPMLGVWGAGLGLAIGMVLPVPAIEAFAASVPGDLAPQTARFALAGGSALTLAVIAFAGGWGMSRRHPAAARPPRAARAAVEPIDPARELGTDSFDAPLPAGLVRSEADWLPEPPAPDRLAAEAAAELAELAQPALLAEPEIDTELEAEADAAPLPPRELDLAGFAALPGRNAVWVHEPEPEPEGPAALSPEPVAEPNPDPALVSAIARLRAVPPAELSLCEMVERFAAALQDYQAARAASGDTEAARREREAVLSEALGALGRITGEGRADGPSASGPALRAQLWAKAEDLAEQRGAA